MIKAKYIDIVNHYEACFEKYGATSEGVDWPNKVDHDKRCAIMLDLIKNSTKSGDSLLDFGCGYAYLIEYIKNYYPSADQLIYSGLELSSKMIHYCNKTYPDRKFYNIDILHDNSTIPKHDFIIMNGVFTEKQSLSYNEMKNYLIDIILNVYSLCNIGIAFNVMSKHVDWERKDLFHLDESEIISFLIKNVSRNFVIRNDYGLYEYTIYVYKQPN